jgi:DNA-binding PadR family transcriptional regulator
MGEEEKSKSRHRPFRWRERVHRRLGAEPWQHWFFGGRRFAAWWTHDGAGSVNPLVSLFLSRGGGILPLFVLHYLAQAARYGNDIMRQLVEQSSGTWASNPGSVYPMLRAMERRGLVIGQWDDTVRRSRRIYRLTDEGRQEYDRIKELMRPGFRQALTVIGSLYNELYKDDAQNESGDAPA